MEQLETQRQYLKNDLRSVYGWLGAVDAEIIHSTMKFQRVEGLNGGVAEIGLHHGKLLIALCLALSDGEKAYGIDIFDAQDLNRDRSGAGNRAILESNLKQYGVDLTHVVLDGRSSELVTASDIVDAVGAVKFFSVDGGHWRDIVVNDLKLAQNTIADHGVIALDDFHRPDWPDVSAGLIDWKRDAPEILPFAVGSNKIYLCRSDYVEKYKTLLLENSYLQSFLVKEYEFLGSRIPIFHLHAEDCLSNKEKARDMFKVFYPNVYMHFLKLLKRTG
ncbi:MAG: class I SAM-dependent methyltransferase [Pseudomonadota bacterium]